MRRITILTMILLFSLLTFAQKPVKVQLKANQSSFEIIGKSNDQLVVRTTISQMLLNPTETEKGVFVNLYAENLLKVFGQGNPNLPVVSKLIEVPQDAEVQINIVSYDEEIINLADYGFSAKLMPAQPSYPKNIDPSDIIFYYDEEAYSKNEFLNSEIAVYEESGMMRATRFGRIEIRPVQYNPVTNQVKVLNNLVIEIKFVNANYAKTQQLKEKYASPYFDGILSTSLINYDNQVSKDLIQNVPVEMVIVSDPMFETQLQPFIEWKELKGFNVTVAYTNVIGTTTTAIKSYLQGLYNGANPPDFVLFVGDVAQIPAWDGNAGSHVTDLRYCEYTGDNIPEVSYGRFSAQNTTQLQPQIDKTMMFEQYTMPDPSYLENNVLIAGVDNSWAHVYGNGAINYISSIYCNKNNGINPLTYLYDDAANSTVMKSDAAGASASIISNISNGVGIANYTAHGSPSGWYNPGFEISDFGSLNNNGKYGLLIGNCCLTNKFDNSECFGEALLRVANKGAIGYIGGSNSTYWDEDYWWATGVGTCVENPTYNNFTTGSYDALFHTMTNEVNDPSLWYITQGHMNLRGQLAVEESSSDMKQYYWEIYHLMGDPTIMPYLGVPDAITYTLTPNVLMIGSSTFDISTVAYATVAVHQDGNRLAVVMTDNNGDATINLSSALTGGEVTLVITAQNHQPLIEAIQPIAASEPYVLVADYTPEVANYNSNVLIDASFQNVASSGYDAASVVATLTTSDPYITIVDGTENIGTINGGQTIDVNDAFEVQIANNVPDQYIAELTITITGSDAKYTWTSNISIVVNAPLLEGMFASVNDSDGQIAFASSPETLVDMDVEYTYNVQVEVLGGNNNGLLDAGETVQLIFNTENIGHAGIYDTYGTLTCSSQYITILNAETYVSSIAVGETFTSEFTVEVDAAAPTGTVAEFTFVIDNTNYSDEVVISLPIGLIIEDFEDGISSYWNLSGNANWAATTTAPYEGTKCAVSGDISDNGSSVISLTLNGVPAGAEMSFWYKVSSEGNYDFLKFNVNGLEIASWSGIVAWSEYTHTFATAGNYTIQFKYSKDGSVSEGSDCGWIDYVVLPVAPVAKSAKSISITGSTLPSWLSIQDNGDGTAVLSGTTPATAGNHDVVITATDGTSTANQEFTIRVGVTSIYTIDNVVNFFPNPTSDILNIQFESQENAGLSISDVNGKIVYSQNLTEQNTQINLSNFAKGVYMINISVDGQILQNKLIIE